MATHHEREPDSVRCQALTDDASAASRLSRRNPCRNAAIRVLVRPGMPPRLACDRHYHAEAATWDRIDPIDPDRLPLKLLEALVAAEGQYQDWIREQIGDLERRLRNARIRQRNASDTLLYRLRQH